jgi:hypothetical protein
MFTLLAIPLLSLCPDSPTFVQSGWDIPEMPNVPLPTPFLPLEFHPSTSVECRLGAASLGWTYSYHASETTTLEMRFSGHHFNCRIREVVSESPTVRISTIRSLGKKTQPIGTFVEIYLGNSTDLSCFLPTDSRLQADWVVRRYLMEGVCISFGN